MTSSLICVMIGSSTAWGAGFGVPVPNLVSQFGEIHQHVGVRWFESGTESLSEITTGLLRPGPTLPLLSPGSDSPFSPSDGDGDGEGCVGSNAKLPLYSYVGGSQPHL